MANQTTPLDLTKKDYLRSNYHTIRKSFIKWMISHPKKAAGMIIRPIAICIMLGEVYGILRWGGGPSTTREVDTRMPATIVDTYVDEDLIGRDGNLFLKLRCMDGSLEVRTIRTEDNIYKKALEYKVGTKVLIDKDYGKDGVEPYGPDYIPPE